ncbi:MULTISPECIES: hypothetical protein [Pseudomonas]|uniref:hypothetical protein n=1 Tax=Pseudomonas TaxID=286 RepID=UPI0015FFE180|nr:hypothetical protein [Pseudomonas putida]
MINGVSTVSWLAKVVSNQQISETALHTYASGAAIGLNGQLVITSPVSGGLVQHDLATGEISNLVDSGKFASPWIFSMQGKPMLMALQNPRIRTTRDFRADIYIISLLR